MSSLIEWPTIYGSVYFLPGIIVVVLMLLLLLLMSSRRRAKAERARLAPDLPLALEGPALEEEEPPAPAPQTAAFPDYSPGVVTQAVVGTMQTGGVVTQPVGLYTPQPVVQPGMMAPQSRMTAPQPSVAPPLVLVPPPPAAIPAPVTMAVAGGTAAPAATAPVTTAPIAATPVLDAFPEPDLMFEPVKSSRRAKSKAARSIAPLSVVSTVNAPVGTDPLNATIQEIMNGWGELAPEDINRLELFRPDRLNAALAALQPPKTKSNDAKVRLTQMRQYGMDLERRAQAVQAAEAAAAAATEATVTMPAGVMPTGGLPAGAPSPSAPAVTDTVTPTATPAPVAAVPEAKAPAVRSFYDAEPEAESPESIDDREALWAAPRPLWEPDPEPLLEELPAPVFDEIDMEPVGRHGVPLDTSALSAALNTPMGMPVRETRAPAIEPDKAVFAPTPPRVEASAYSKPFFDDDLFWDDEPGAISRLSAKVETAEQLMALPPTERVDMTAFLPPTELAATFRATHDLELKKAVIDTLEHIGTPASLNALGNCFEDTDADIQVYALAAADRLLGVA